MMRNDYTEEEKDVVRTHLATCPWRLLEEKLLKEEIEQMTERIVEDSPGGRLDEVARNHLIDLRLIHKALLDLPKKMFDYGNIEDKTATSPRWMEPE